VKGSGFDLQRARRSWKASKPCARTRSAERHEICLDGLRQRRTAMGKKCVGGAEQNRPDFGHRVGGNSVAQYPAPRVQMENGMKLEERSAARLALPDLNARGNPLERLMAVVGPSRTVRFRDARNRYRGFGSFRQPGKARLVRGDPELFPRRCRAGKLAQSLTGAEEVGRRTGAAFFRRAELRRPPNNPRVGGRGASGHEEPPIRMSTNRFRSFKERRTDRRG